MKKVLYAYVFGLIIWVPSAAHSNPAQSLTQRTGSAVTLAPTTEEIVAGVQTFYETVENFHADFTQTYENIALGDEQVSTGHVFFRKPGRMRWDYVTPVEKYLISNGQILWMFEPEFNQVARLDLSESELPTAIGFLMGEGELATDFTITQTACDFEGAYCLNLIPRVSEGQYQSLDFVVDSSDFHVRQTVILDPIGNRNQFVFTNPSTSDELPEAGFEFEPTAEMRLVTP